LLKLNKIPPAEESRTGRPIPNRSLAGVISPKNPDYKVYYEGFHENLIVKIFPLSFFFNLNREKLKRT